MEFSEITKKLDDLLGKVDLSKTTEEGVKTTLPDGYYLCMVSKAELKSSKSSGNPMVSIEYTTLEDGQKQVKDDDGFTQLAPAPGTKDKKIYSNYVFTQEKSVTFFVSDMLKFQDLETDEPFFDKETDFADSEAIVRVCDTLTEGGTIYLMLQTIERTNENGEKVTDQKVNPISWNKARKLGLLE